MWEYIKKLWEELQETREYNYYISKKGRTYQKILEMCEDIMKNHIVVYEILEVKEKNEKRATKNNVPIIIELQYLIEQKYILSLIINSSKMDWNCESIKLTHLKEVKLISLLTQ